MGFLRGEDVQIGIGAEDTRGVAVAPQAWIPGRTPAGIKPVIDKVDLKETRGTKIESHASEIVAARAEGDLEFNVRSNSIGYILHSLLGAVDSEAVGGQTGVYDHVFSVLLADPEHPSITIALHQPGQQDYNYPLGTVVSLELSVTPDDLVKCTVKFVAKKEQEKGSPAYVPAYEETDIYFRHQDVKVYIENALDDMSGATPYTGIKDLGVSIPNNGRPDQNISDENPSNVIAPGPFAPKVTMTIDQLDKTLHDFFTGATYKAVRVKMERADLTIGSSAHPSITIDFAKMSCRGWDPDRPIDDVVRQKLELVAHYSDDDSKALDITVRNTKADYDPDES